MIYPVIMREIQSREVDNVAFCDDSKNCWDTIRSQAKT